MTQKGIENKYFEWMYKLVCDNRYADDISYRKLLKHLHEREFVYSIQRDSNRAADGIDLRRRYGYRHYIEHIDDYIQGPCSVLEMLIALAIRCEESIMDDPSIGDRTGQWFWMMINNLKLGGMTDTHYDEVYVDDVLDVLLNREYDADGRGGLFVVRNSQYDMREIEIWTQLCYFLDNIT